MSVVQISAGKTTKLLNASIDGSSSEEPFEQLERGWEWCSVNGEVGCDETCPIWVHVLDRSSGRERLTLQGEGLTFSWRVGDRNEGRIWGRWPLFRELAHERDETMGLPEGACMVSALRATMRSIAAVILEQSLLWTTHDLLVAFLEVWKSRLTLCLPPCVSAATRASASCLAA